MVDPRQPGKKTYQRVFIRTVFEGQSYIDSVLENIKNRINNSSVDAQVAHLPPTKFGENARLEITHDEINSLEVGLYRNGWIVDVRTIHFHAPGREYKEKIFGDKNASGVWTPETEKVPQIIKDLIKEIENLR